MTIAKSQTAADGNDQAPGPPRQCLERRKLLADREQAAQLAQTIRGMLASGRSEELSALLGQYYPPDLADVMLYLDDAQDKAVFELLGPAEQAAVLDEVDEATRAKLAAAAPAERLARILLELPADEGADILGALPARAVAPVLAAMPADKAGAIRALLAYPKESAGGIMAVRFVAVREEDGAADALRAFREMADAEPILDVYVVDEKGALRGVVGLRELLNADPGARVRDLMQRAIASVAPNVDQEQVARVFARYNLLSLPVVEREGGRLVGVITSNDVIDVIQAEGTEDAMRLAGWDAAEMERRSPTQTALLRLPWIMATMFIELSAGFVIHIYDGTLARVLLLASFMPIISAISGNRGCNRQRLSCGDYQPGKSRRAIGGGPSLDSSERMPTTGKDLRFSAP